MNKTSEAILKTIIYADIFGYPLTIDEIKRFLICHPEQSEGSQWDSSASPRNDKNIGTDGKYFFLKNRKEIVILRKKRERWSREKLKIAAKAASWLKLIPWIKMVGVTGSLAMLNADQDDDIDFLIVSDTHRLWLTRFLATILMELLRVRRRPLANKKNRTNYRDRGILSKPQPSQFKDKICLNMYLAEAHLAVPFKEQDLFTAHEVVQVRLLWEKDGIYDKFLIENLWVKKYLPNALVIARSVVTKQSHGPIVILNLFQNPLRLPRELCSLAMTIVENLVKKLQLRYMKSRRTTEVISDGVIRFHPRDARKWVLTRYRDSLKIALIRKE